jgi:hypothetical protein
MAAHELDLKTPLCVVRAPNIERVGVMFNPDTSPQSKFFVRSVEAAAPSLLAVTPRGRGGLGPVTSLLLKRAS